MMTNPTDTNQASEDEIRETLLDKLAIIKYGEAYKWLFDVDKSNVDLWTKDLLALIRTEKLKLLAEVRERVVGENQHSEHKEWDCPCGATHSFTEEWHATNRLRDEQRVALTKLEAEL